MNLAHLIENIIECIKFVLTRETPTIDHCGGCRSFPTVFSWVNGGRNPSTFLEPDLPGPIQGGFPKSRPSQS